MTPLAEVCASYHESGHCCGFWAIGKADQINYAQLRPKGCVYSHPGRRRIFEQAVIYMAGPTAEALYRNVPVEEVLATSGRTDLTRCRQTLELYSQYPEEMAEIVGYFGRVPEVEDAATNALRLVYEHWRAVRRVAVELLACSRLDQAARRSTRRSCASIARLITSTALVNS